MLQDRHRIHELQAVIYSTVRKVAGDFLSEADLDDVVQDVNVALLTSESSRSLEAFDPNRGMKVSTFVYMVAQSMTLDAMRSNRRRPHHVEIDPTHDTRPAFHSPNIAESAAENRLLEKERIELLQHAVESLPASDREFAVALFAGELDIEALAVELHTTVNALYIRKCRLLRRLIKLISNPSAS